MFDYDDEKNCKGCGFTFTPENSVPSGNEEKYCKVCKDQLKSKKICNDIRCG